MPDGGNDRAAASGRPQLAARLVASCDPATAAGRRDRAIVVLLARLGLRGQEVADLELGDIDWRAGEVVIRGKGHSRDSSRFPRMWARMPATCATPPASASRRCSVARARARCRPARSAVVGTLLGGCQDRRHRLRHMTGTEMLRAGVSLAEVGQVLRQRSALVTSNYARVDRTALRASPAPGREAGDEHDASSGRGLPGDPRSLGFKLVAEGYLLRSFAGYAERAGARQLTTTLRWTGRRCRPRTGWCEETERGARLRRTCTPRPARRFRPAAAQRTAATRTSTPAGGRRLWPRPRLPRLVAATYETLVGLEPPACASGGGTPRPGRRDWTTA